MSYVGGAPAKSLASPTSQYFNGDGSTTVFTLNRPVNVSEELEVFVNNVQQEPGVGKSYTASETSLTFDAAPSSGTNNVYVVYRGLSERAIRLEATGAAGAGYFQGENGAVGDTTNGKGDIFRVHEKQLDTSVTIAGTDNALCAGPLTLATGVVITVSTGGTLVIA
jgi:hypothetical protein